MNLRKISFTVSEVIAYIEYKLLHNEATCEEESLYIQYRWSNKLNKFTYKQIVKEMKLQYN